MQKETIQMKEKRKENIFSTSMPWFLLFHILY
jgi:hypothetical protein